MRNPFMTFKEYIAERFFEEELDGSFNLGIRDGYRTGAAQ